MLVLFPEQAATAETIAEVLSLVTFGLSNLTSFKSINPWLSTGSHKFNWEILAYSATTLLQAINFKEHL